MYKLNSMKYLLSLIICVTSTQFCLLAQSTWISQPQLTGSLYSLYFANNQTGWTVGTTGVYKTTSGGLNWTLQSSDSARGVCFINGNTGIIGGHNPKRTSDGGATWTNLSRFADTIVYDISRTDSMILYACGGRPGTSHGVIWRSTNAGNNWVRVYNYSNSGRFHAVHFINYNTGWACSHTGAVYRTTDGGYSSIWSLIVIGVLYDIQFVDQYTGWLTNNTGIIRKSTNGASWNQQFLPYTGGYALHFSNSSDGRVVGPNGIMRTVNGGSNWFTETSPTTEQLNAIFFTGNDTSYICGTNGTILKTVNGGAVTNIQNTSSEIPKEFSLSQNIPNPFNPVTSIEFRLPERDFATLRVYDAMGREIEVLVKGELNPGTFRAEWNAANYSSGIYFYSIETGTFTETRKMIVIK